MKKIIKLICILVLVMTMTGCTSSKNKEGFSDDAVTHNIRNWFKSVGNAKDEKEFRKYFCDSIVNEVAYENKGYIAQNSDIHAKFICKINDLVYININAKNSLSNYRTYALFIFEVDKDNNYKAYDVGVGKDVTSFKESFLCKNCAGRGIIGKPCKECGSAGYYHNDYGDVVYCKNCKGEGLFERKDCPQCDGLGYIYKK